MALRDYLRISLLILSEFMQINFSPPEIIRKHVVFLMILCGTEVN